MKNIILVFFVLLLICTKTYAAEFEDIDGHWAADTIIRLADKGIINGVSETSYCPENNVTRAEFLKLAMVSEGITPCDYRAGECLDATAEDWFAPYLQRAIDSKLIPQNMITGYVKNYITDQDTGENRVIYMGAFNGNFPITREEMAVIAQAAYQFSRTKDNVGKMSTTVSLDFTDREKISPWARYGVALATANGFINGMSDGSFMPEELTTRAQAAVVIERMLEKN